MIVPRLAAMFSAWGMLTSDLRYEVSRTHVGDISALSAHDLRRLYQEMEADGRRRLANARFEGPVRVRRSADMRYGEQIFEIGVPLDGIDWAREDLVGRIADAFHARHEQLYTYALRDQEAVLVNARLAVTGELPPLIPEAPRTSGAPVPPRARRRCHIGGWRELEVYGFDDLAAGQVVEGPALIESSTTTVLLRDGDRAEATPLGWLDVAVGQR